MQTEKAPLDQKNDSQWWPGPPRRLGVGSAVVYLRAPLGFLERGAHTYGSSFRFYFGDTAIYVLSHPDLIQRILKDNSGNYGKDTFRYQSAKPAFGQGPGLTEGELWRWQRRALSRAVGTERLSEVLGEMDTAAKESADRCARQLTRGEVPDLTAEVRQQMIRIVGLTLFSVDFGSDAPRLARAMGDLVEHLGARIKVPLSLPWSTAWPGVARFRRALRQVDEWLYDIARRRLAEGGGGSDAPGMLIEHGPADLQLSQLRDSLFTLLFTGAEPSANVLLWGCHLLARHPGIQERVHGETVTVLGDGRPTAESLADLTYTRMTVREVVRLYPPIWMSSRNAIEADELDGRRLPRGAILMYSPYVIHRHPKFWGEPDRFSPERFAPEATERRHPFAYFPHGAGPRACIGTHFAMAEIQVFLAALLQRFRLKDAGGPSPSPSPELALRPRPDIRVILKPR
jgi:cytochrome P450